MIHYSDDHSWAFLGPTLREVADLEPGYTNL
jgi:hypothetical protein